MNNTLQSQFQQRLKSFNPSEMLDKIANNPQMMQNPMIKNVMDMRNNKDSEGLNSMANNMFQENGINFSDFEQRMKQQLNFK